MYASRSIARLRGPATAARIRPLQVQYARCFSDDRGMKAVTVFQRQRLPPNLGFVVRAACLQAGRRHVGTCEFPRR